MQSSTRRKKQQQRDPTHYLGVQLHLLQYVSKGLLAYLVYNYSSPQLHHQDFVGIPLFVKSLNIFRSIMRGHRHAAPPWMKAPFREHLTNKTIMGCFRFG